MLLRLHPQTCLKRKLDQPTAEKITTSVATSVANIWQSAHGELPASDLLGIWVAPETWGWRGN